MGQATEFANLTNASFDDFVRFLFDRQVDPKPKPPKKWNPWHFHVSAQFDPEMMCSYYVKLFHQPRFLLGSYTRDQLEEGFWAIQGPNLACSAYRLIHDAELPLMRRADLIRSMQDLFEHLFADQAFDTSVQMWWDSLCYDWHCQNRRRERGGDDEQLQDIFFGALSRVLAIDSQICQDAALHGLGHLHHPQTQALVHRFLAEHPQIPGPQKQYALAAARFEVL